MPLMGIATFASVRPLAHAGESEVHSAALIGQMMISDKVVRHSHLACQKSRHRRCSHARVVTAGDSNKLPSCAACTMQLHV